MGEVVAGLRSWSDLPSEILSSIADRLSLIELLSFRGVCKDFRSASSGASAETGSGNPWLMFYGIYSSKCIRFFNLDQPRKYTRIIPALEGATYLASYQGWLLLFKDETVFFFCPFSLAKITLPDFPHKKMAGYVAAFSDIPTSSDCIVSVIKQISETDVEVNVISKGGSAWTQHKVSIVPILSGFSWVPSYVVATFDSKTRTFYYFMDSNKLYVLKFSLKDNRPLPYSYQWNELSYRIPHPKIVVLNPEGYPHVIVCTFRFEPLESNQFVSPNDAVDVNVTMSEGFIWVQPRFFQVDPNQHWCNV